VLAENFEFKAGEQLIVVWPGGWRWRHLGCVHSTKPPSTKSGGTTTFVATLACAADNSFKSSHSLTDPQTVAPTIMSQIWPTL
jgi:hypothetical protein